MTSIICNSYTKCCRACLHSPASQVPVLLALPPPANAWGVCLASQILLSQRGEVRLADHHAVTLLSLVFFGGQGKVNPAQGTGQASTSLLCQKYQFLLHQHLCHSLQATLEMGTEQGAVSDWF